MSIAAAVMQEIMPELAATGRPPKAVSINEETSVCTILTHRDHTLIFPVTLCCVRHAKMSICDALLVCLIMAATEGVGDIDLR